MGNRNASTTYKCLQHIVTLRINPCKASIGKCCLIITFFIALAVFYTPVSAEANADINIGLHNTTCGQFEVRLQPGDHIEAGISNIQFAIKWPEESVTLESFESDLDVELQYQETHGGFHYAVFVAVPDQDQTLDWQAGEEYVIMTFAHDESGDGTADFLIADDQWTTDNHAPFYVELWGMDKTGHIYHQAEDTYVGECPYRINIGIYNTECARFEVRLRPDDHIEAGISNIQFAIKWPEESVTLENFKSDLGVELQYQETHGGFHYAVFVAVPDQDQTLDWQAGEEYVIMTFAHDESGSGTVDFLIADDQWTIDNDAPFYVEQWGMDETGYIYHQAEDTYIGMCRFLDIRVFLEGPYNKDKGTMHTSLNEQGLTPRDQPYNAAPWNYAGKEHAVSLDEDIVDWVIVEFRDARTAEKAIETTPFYTRALLLTKEGYLVNQHMQNPSLHTNKEIEDGLFLIIRHRNHIDILSNDPLPFDEGSKAFSIDFSTSTDKVFGGAVVYNQIDTGLFGMVAGDSNQEQGVSVLDFNLWRNSAGKENVYDNSDFRMTGSVTVIDFNLWRNNAGKTAEEF